jgi:hypothetical protein
MGTLSSAESNGQRFIFEDSGEGPLVGALEELR